MAGRETMDETKEYHAYCVLLPSQFNATIVLHKQNAIGT